MKTSRNLATSTLCVLSLSASALLAAPALAQAPAAKPAPPAQPAATADQTITESDIITGTMDIDFNTRTNLDTTGDLKAGSAALGAQDKYKFSFTVAKTTQFSGEITRQPKLESSILGKVKQASQLAFSIDLSVLNPRDPKQKKTVGKWVGLVPVDPASGAYDLEGGAKLADDQKRPLRIKVEAMGQSSGFEDFFRGKMIGKAEKKEGLAAYTYKRLVGGKQVSVVVKQSDPMRFENIVLAKGPSENYPSTTVNGRLDYDYETGNWFTDGIRFKYSANGKDFEDVVTGSIKWVEDPSRESNGKGYYEFNLRFNEEKNKSVADESAAFKDLSGEEAFFFVDDSIPCLTGRVNYVDVMSPGAKAPSSSKVTYNLNANKLTKQQVMNFFKLWTICIGPTNDE